MTRIVLLFASYGPYHLARINSFQKHCVGRGWEAIGMELARTEMEYPWKTEVKDLPIPIISVIDDRPLEHAGFSYLICHLYHALTHIQPDVLAISGYGRPAMLAALGWSLWHRKPTVLFSETTEADGVRSPWQEHLKRAILKAYKAALVGGQMHHRYLVKLGMPAARIFSGYDVVDNQTFHPDCLKPLRRPIENPYFLSISRFIPKKNLSFLLTAYTHYQQQAGVDAWDLVLCGDGELRPQIEQQITDLNLTSTVHLTGFLQERDLLPYLAHAYCFIHASTHEQWGLVVNEAMAAGLPVLVSNRCGCFADLVLEGVTGFGFDPENLSQLVDLMLKVSSGQIVLEPIAQAALNHIQKFSPDAFAQGLTQAIEYALTHS